MTTETRDSGGDAAPEEGPPQTRRKLPVIVPTIIAASFFMEGLDSSIINTSLPQMARTFEVTAPQMSAAITAYLLALAIFIPISGWMADKFGTRLVFCGAIVLFTVGSLMSGLSSSLGMLVFSRAVQGIGGAMLTPVGRLILARAFPKHELMRAMTLYMLPANLGPTVGPVLGGFITTQFGWQWNFFMNIPIGLIGMVLALRYIENAPTPRPGRFDWWGYLILACGVAAAQLALDSLAHAEVGTGLLLPLAVAAALFLAGYGFYAKRHPHPVLDFRLFRIRVFAISLVFGNLLRTSVYPISFLVALLLQLGFGLNPFEAGLLTCFFTMGAMTMRANIARITQTFGMRRVLIAVSLTTAAFTAGFTLLTPETPHWLIAIYLFGFGVLRNAQHQTTTALSLADVPDEDFSKATTMQALLQRGGQSLGVGMSAGLLSVFAGGAQIEVSTFHPVFLILALIAASGAIGFSRLKPEDGWQVSGHRSKP